MIMNRTDKRCEIIATEQMLQRPDLIKKIEKASECFPELAKKRVVVGLSNGKPRGATWPYNSIILFNENKQIPYYTIGHELIHLLQYLQFIPRGEVNCDLFTIARNELFLDESPSYIGIKESSWMLYRYQIQELVRDCLSKQFSARKITNRINFFLKQHGEQN